jgi:hypothetical protein
MPARWSSPSIKEWPWSPVGGVKGKETGHADEDRPHPLVPDVEGIVGEAAPLVRQYAVVGILPMISDILSRSWGRFPTSLLTP